VRVILALLLLAVAAAPAAAQIDGHVSVMFDGLPDTDPAAGRQFVGELRARVFAERGDQFGEHLRLTLAGYADGLLAHRYITGVPHDARAAIARPTEVHVEFVSTRFDIRAGASRLVWGRLDEFQPTDVVNPIDLTRFVLEGRGEARLAVGLVRARLFLPHSSTIETVIVPAFRASRFDQLDEASSPFNLANDAGRQFRPAGPDAAAPVYVLTRSEPRFGAGSAQGGGRFTSTIGRVDWGVSVYRGLRTFPIVTVSPAVNAPPVVTETFPRFTMIGGEFETVRGPWGVRGEVAVFPHDQLQSTRVGRGVPGHGIESGIGVDRRAGVYRVAANVLWSWRRVDTSTPGGREFEGDQELERSDVSLVIAADRSFARETRTLRVLAVYDPSDATVFSRAIGALSVHDNVWIEGSAGVFAGSSLDTIGRLTQRDFAYVRLKVFF
jgi:hypothetical protein